MRSMLFLFFFFLLLFAVAVGVAVRRSGPNLGMSHGEVQLKRAVR